MKIARLAILFILLLILLIICAVILISCKNDENSPGHFVAAPSEREPNKPPSATESRLEGGVGEADGGSQTDKTAEITERRLFCKHTDLPEFYNSVQNPKEFKLNCEDGKAIIGGIVPHHMTAATLISGFFKAVAESGVKYDTVVIVAPNHQGETGDVVVSFKDWQAWDTVFCDRDILDGVYQKIQDNCGVTPTESDDRMEEDHSVSGLIPYINYYMPESKVAAFLLSRRLTLETVFNFSGILSDEIKEINLSGKKVLFICSVDFSHYLPVKSAAENDRITEAAIIDRNYSAIHGFSNAYVDSPQSLNTFLMYLENIGTDKNNLEILYNTDASEFLGDGIAETTTYFIIAAYK